MTEGIQNRILNKKLEKGTGRLALPCATIDCLTLKDKKGAGVMANWSEFLTWLSAFVVGGGGTGLLFVGYLKRQKKAETEAKEADAKATKAEAEAKEDSAFSQRIAFLSDQLEASNNKAKELADYVDGLEKKVRELTRLLDERDAVIRAQKSVISEQKETISSLEEELRLLREKNELLARRRAHTKSEITLMKKNDEKKM